jgi:hypothetical protein
MGMTPKSFQDGPAEGPRKRLDVLPVCPTCGYNMTGLAGNRCPECGHIATKGEIERDAKVVKDTLVRLQGMQETVRVGYYLGPTGLVILLASWIAGFDFLGRFIAFFIGLGTMGAGLQIIRVKHLPSWAVEMLPEKPDFLSAILVILVGVVTVALCIVLP